MSNQLRFSGKSIEEALAKARAALGEGVRLIAAERVSKPGFVGRRISFTIVVEPPTAPISAPGFAAALRNVLVNSGPRPSGPSDADEYDYRSVRDELAKTYERPMAAGPIQAPPTPKVFRRDGKVTKLANVSSPQWSLLDEPIGPVAQEVSTTTRRETMIEDRRVASSATRAADQSDLSPLASANANDDPDVGDIEANRTLDLAAMESEQVIARRESSDKDTMPNGSMKDQTGLTEAQMVEAAQRAMLEPSSLGSFLVDRIDSMMIDLSGDEVVLDVREAPLTAEVVTLPPSAQLVAVVVPSAADPLDRFSDICSELAIEPEHRFILARRRREIPAAMLSSTNLVARSVVESAAAGGRRAVLVDPGQLRLLRGSFLDPMLAVVVAVEGTESIFRLEREISPCGEVDAIWYGGADRVAIELGIPRLGRQAPRADR